MISKSDIEKLFERQLRRIGDDRLRDLVAEIWTEGCRRGNWQNPDELENMPFTLLTDSRGVSFIEHTIAVTEGAVALAESQMKTYREMPYRVDMDRLVAGGLLHDVGKLLEIEKDGRGGYRKSLNGRCTRHPISGAILAAEMGADEHLLNTIACHAKEGEGRPQVLETVFIHQADYATFDPLVLLEKNNLIQ
ncbi:HD domain-containing protein [bacterium]|nr:HD domain-containing protein [candidate division CSSED10-310 bacterium]